MFYHGNSTELIEILASASLAAVMIFLIVIGVVAIVSLILIRRFMQTLPRNQRISIKALLIHAGAFGLFLVSELMYTIVWTISNLNLD